jgi:hypothetical protein
MLLQFQLYFEESFAVTHITGGELRVTTSRFVDGAVTELAAVGTYQSRTFLCCCREAVCCDCHPRVRCL